MNAYIHKTDKRPKMTASLKKWNKEKDEEIVLFYLQVNCGRPQREIGLSAVP